MSIVTIPATVAATIGGQTFGQRRFDLAEVSDANGAAAVNANAPPRWTVGLRAPQWLTPDEADEWTAMLLQLRGGINHLAVYDVLRPAPRGTMRGAPVLGAAVMRGDTSIVVTKVVGTLKANDWLGLGSGLGTSQLVKATAAVASSVLTASSATWRTSAAAVAGWHRSGGAVSTWWRGGTVTVPIEPPARDDYPAGTEVAWDKPVTYVTMTNDRFSWSAEGGDLAPAGFAFDGMEQWD